ncbi:ABSCISIC ACID-INSENSITIVE 5-like protein 2 [Typha latifolia]|uniref:ABSCISIC ACID-INSENSITIVE 5-like protein 2 n=1 Tax=Typha latifolia TaxID=4733 RepID=UPI003C2FC2F8
MGVQAMASESGGGGRQSQLQSLSRQGSIYSLTLNEVQNHLGEPLHSMNLDELLRNVLPAELDNLVAGANSSIASGVCMHRQGSITMSPALSKKTVDEVWRDIQQGQRRHERHKMLGEMTLEDFLGRAGVAVDGSDKRSNPNIGNAGLYPREHWLQQYQHHNLQLQQQAQQTIMGTFVGVPMSQPLGVAPGPILDAVYPEDQGTNSPTLVEAISDPQTPGRKRGTMEDVTEKTVERRQKRMIKNRESAARSRARKQAYTNELENKISRLEEENEMLKKQKELEPIIHYVTQPEPKHQLRRTSSAPI